MCAPVAHECVKEASVAISKERLVEGLNQDLAGEYQAIIMYIQYAASVKGPYRQQLSQFFAGEIADELGHAQFLANKIAALDGVPTVQPKPVPQASDAKTMLQNVLKAETETIAAYNERVKQAEEYGDTGLVNQLEDQIADETTHKEETAKLLTGWS
jgi:bacterioferritin